MRLNRYLAAAGIASRRDCDELIASGAVTINGRVCTDFSVQPAAEDHVKVRGKLVRLDPPRHLIMHKPRGYVSTREDPRATRTIFALLPARFPRVFHVGRLDAASEGLLLLTNDGDLAQRLTHPRHKIEKEYEVILDRPWDPSLSQKLVRGINLDDQRAFALRVQQLGPFKLRLVLTQGLNRQIRRMLHALGYEAKRLVRIRLGPLTLAGVAPGQWRPLTQRELAALRGERTASAAVRRTPPAE